MNRAIRDHIRQPLADELLFGRLAMVALVVDFEDGEFVFRFPTNRTELDIHAIPLALERSLGSTVRTPRHGLCVPVCCPSSSGVPRATSWP